MNPPRIALYGHDTLGLGHLRRNLALARAMSAVPAAPDVLVLSSAVEATGFDLPPGVDLVLTPGINKDSGGSYGSRRLRGDLSSVLDVRRATMAAAIEAFDPHLFVIDKVPYGFGGELLPLLDRLCNNRTRVVLGLRDVLDSPIVARAEWRSLRFNDALHRHIDQLWVYGDRRAGRYLLDGHDVRDLTLASVRSHIAVVLQDSVLFATSIAENIRWGRLDASDEDVRSAAVMANADGFIRELSDGYDTVIGERGSTLSGGQRQRIAIARAILRDAAIVILDEPTTGLDRAGEEEVLCALRTLTRSRTTVLITHDPALTQGADRIIEIAGGRIHEVTGATGHDKTVALSR